MLGTILDQVYRRESGRVLAGLIRHFGDFDLAEDALQDAFAKAMIVWARDGLPDNPAAWLTTVARRRSIDIRRRKLLAALPDHAAAPVETETGDAVDSGVDDDRLRLLFTCCHPTLNRETQVALALKTLGGLSTREIARAYVEAEATTAQRLVRAKTKIREAKIPYRIPTVDELPARVEAVLETVYLIFNEGYAATDSPDFLRPDLSGEAIRLGRLLVELLPQESEGRGLLALMLLTDARRPARLNAEGEMIALEDQDRLWWNQSMIAEGTQMLDGALPLRRPGVYQIQAAIAALHSNAATAEATDWLQIAALYGAFLRKAPTPIIELNAAVAIAFAGDGESGLKWLQEIETRGVLNDYHLLPAAQAELLRRSGKGSEATPYYERALSLVKTRAERVFLQRRMMEASATHALLRHESAIDRQ